MLQGIRGISRELEDVVECLPPAGLKKIVDAALTITADEYAADVDVRDAIASYQADPAQARSLVGSLAEKSKACDEAYIRLEQAGRMDEAAVNFRKMCVLNGLSALLSAPDLTHRVVDRLIYELGHGAADTDSFAERMIGEVEALVDGRGSDHP